VSDMCQRQSRCDLCCSALGYVPEISLASRAPPLNNGLADPYPYLGCMTDHRPSEKEVLWPCHRPKRRSTPLPA